MATTLKVKLRTAALAFSGLTKSVPLVRHATSGESAGRGMACRRGADHQQPEHVCGHWAIADWLDARAVYDLLD